MGDKKIEFVETCSLKWLDWTISTRHGKYENYEGLKEKDDLQYLMDFLKNSASFLPSF